MQKLRVKTVLFAAVAGVGLVAAAPRDRSMVAIAGDPVSTETGKVAGAKLASGVKAYLGIPFAAPPMEQLRWAPPQPISWKGVWNADRKGPQCMQVMRPHDINHYFGEEVMSEDCLYLNLWAPETATPKSKLPVIVFIYGGGFTIGASSMAIYNGDQVAKVGAIYVNFNYRVGSLGFLAHPELSKEQGGHSGNYGIMDQTAALRWIKANIAQFGGDPDRVVIMGQSAGAGSVIAQIFSPQAKGLFSGAVMSSGCNFKNESPTLAAAEKTGVTFQEYFKAPNIAAMRNLAADRIIAAQSENQLGLSVAGVRIAGPIIDGHVLPETKAAMFAAGSFNKVPIIAGYNSNDLSFGFEPLLSAKTVADYEAAASKLYGANAPGFLKLFPAKSDADVPRVARAAATAAGLESNARGCAEIQAKAGQKAWINEYARVHPYVPGVRLADQNPATIGAYHTADIPYWFSTIDAFNSLRPTRNWTDWDRKLSGQMTNALINFAATGNPSTPAMNWPAWNAKAESKIMFGDSVSLVKLDTKRANWLAAHPVAALPPVPRTGGPRD